MKRYTFFSLMILLLGMTLYLSGTTQVAAQQEQNAGHQLVAIPSFSPIVEKAKPALVNIAVTKVSAGQSFMTEEDFFDYFFGNPRAPYRVKENVPSRFSGSGFIVDADGYIITNNHVIEKAEEIKIKLSGGEELDVEVIGRDSKTDLALLK